MEKRAGIYRSQFYAPDQIGPKGTIPEPTDEEKKVMKADREADEDEYEYEYEYEYAATQPRYDLYEDGTIIRVEPAPFEEEVEEFHTPALTPILKNTART